MQVGKKMTIDVRSNTMQFENSLSDLLANISLIIHHSCLILRQQDSLESIKTYQHG